MKRPEIIDEARRLVKDAGGQVAVAERLGVTQSSISKALKPGDTSMDELRRRILSELGRIEVDAEPSFIVRSVRRRAAHSIAKPKPAGTRTTKAHATMPKATAKNRRSKG